MACALEQTEIESYDRLITDKYRETYKIKGTTIKNVKPVKYKQQCK